MSLLIEASEDQGYSGGNTGPSSQWWALGCRRGNCSCKNDAFLHSKMLKGVFNFFMMGRVLVGGVGTWSLTPRGQTRDFFRTTWRKLLRLRWKFQATVASLNYFLKYLPKVLVFILNFCADKTLLTMSTIFWGKIDNGALCTKYFWLKVLELWPDILGVRNSLNFRNMSCSGWYIWCISSLENIDKNMKIHC